MLSPEAARKLVKDELYPKWEHEREHLDRVDRWMRWRQDDIPLPRKTTTELRQLAKLSRVPWLSLVVTVVAQAMYVDGYRFELDPVVENAGEAEERRASPPWRT